MAAVAHVRRNVPLALLSVLLGGASAALIIAFARVSESLDVLSMAAAGVGGAVCAWLLLTRRHGVALIVVALYLGVVDGYLRLSTGQANLTLVRDVLFYLALIGAGVRLAARGGRLDVPPWTGWVAAFVALALVQVLNPASPSLQHALLGLRPHLEWVPLFFFGYALMRTPYRLQVFLVVLIALAAVNGIVSFIQFKLTPQQLAAWGPGYSDLILGSSRQTGRVYHDLAGAHVRPPALGSDAGFGGRLGFIAVPAAIALVVGVHKRSWRLVGAVMAGGVALAVITSQERTVLVAAFVATVAFATFATVGGKGLRVVAGLTVAAVVAYGAVAVVANSALSDPFTRYATIAPGSLISSATRERGSSLAAIPDSVARAPLGLGLGRSGPAAGRLGSDAAAGGQITNSETEFNFLLNELGVPGLIILFGFSVTVILAALGIVRRLPDRDTRLLVAAVAAPLVAILVIWVSTSTSATTPLSPYMWFASGAVAFWWRQTRRSPT